MSTCRYHIKIDVRSASNHESNWMIRMFSEYIAKTKAQLDKIITNCHQPQNKMLVYSTTARQTKLPLLTIINTISL